MNLGVYIISLNEEIFIRDCITPIKKIFPQVELIDLGSRDSTLKKAKRTGIKINSHKIHRGDYSNLKNSYAQKHDWVFFVDGDEIFPIDQLLKIKQILGSKRKKHFAYRIGWKNLRIKDNDLQISELRINGCKLYKSNKFNFKRGWPREVLQPIERINRKRKQSPFKCELWCYHCVLLKRSFGKEDKARIKKRKGSSDKWRNSNWISIDNLPWRDNQLTKQEIQELNPI